MSYPYIDSPKPLNIEHHIKHKENEANSRANSQVEAEFRAKYPKQNELVAKNFELENTEFVIDHYSCAHYGKIPKQGRLFITPKYVLFFANILGKKVKKKIPFADIEDIKRESVTLLAVSPIEIQLRYKRFTFVSFLHREKALANLHLQWKSNKEGRPYIIKIRLDEDDDNHEEGEHASLSSNVAAEPMDSGTKLEVQSMWGGQSQTAAASDTSTKGKARGIMSAMPRMYSQQSSPGGGGGQEEKKRSCCGCLPCFK